MLEVGGFATGPFATMLLGDLGAEVIKIERPGSGDPWRKLDENTEFTPTFMCHNRNKKSLQLDISRTSGREVFLRLANISDIIVENLRPGTMAKLRLAYEDIVKVNPRIVYCSASCFGPTNPRPGYDTTAQGISGLLSTLTDLNNPEIRGPHFGDLLAGMFTAYGALAGLIEARKNGSGVNLSVSMIASCMTMASVSILNNLESKGKENASSRVRRSQGYAFLTKDYPIVIHLSTPERFWHGLIEAIDMKELLDDERFKNSSGRTEYYEELRRILQPIFLTKTRSEWLDGLLKRDVPCGPLNSVSQVLEDEVVKELENFRWTKGFPHILNPVNFSGFERLANEAPSLGQNSREILEKIGYTQEEIDMIITDSERIESNMNSTNPHLF